MAPPEVRVEWDAGDFERRAKAHAAVVLTQIGILITTRAKQLLSVPGTGRKKGRKAGKVTHAPAGEPPFKQTGRLRASVTYEVDEQAGTMRAGTNVEYGRHLELGTKRGIKPHPWLRRAAAEVGAQIQALLATLTTRF